MLCHVELQDAPTIVRDDEEAVEHAEGDRPDCEEIHRGDSFVVASKKGELLFGWLGISRRLAHPAADRLLGDIKTEHEKLAMDARRSPGRILGV
jgi:hypothetical protein